MKTTCEDCTGHFSQCSLYDIFEDSLLPRAERERNCPYCFLSDEKQAEREEMLKKLEEDKKRIEERRSKRKSRKNKNRFDEDEEIYEYNFKSSLKGQMDMRLTEGWNSLDTDKKIYKWERKGKKKKNTSDNGSVTTYKLSKKEMDEYLKDIDTRGVKYINLEDKRQVQFGGVSTLLYLYDARYNLKTETTLEKISKLLKKKEIDLSRDINTLEKVKKWYIVDESVDVKELKKLYEKEVFKNEVWKVIEGSDDKFLVSNYGRFKRIYKNSPNRKFIMPYYQTRKVNVNKNKQFIKVKFKEVYKEYSVSRIVAYHFVEIFYDGYGFTSESKPIKYKNKKFEDLVVYHKNGLVYDNYHANLEFLDREDLAKKTAHKSKGGRTIVAIDAETGDIIDYFKSTRHVEANLPVSKQAVSDSLNKVWKTNIVGGKYIFEYEQ